MCHAEFIAWSIFLLGTLGMVIGTLVEWSVMAGIFGLIIHIPVIYVHIGGYVYFLRAEKNKQSE